MAFMPSGNQLQRLRPGYNGLSCERVLTASLLLLYSCISRGKCNFLVLQRLYLSHNIRVHVRKTLEYVSEITVLDIC